MKIGRRTILKMSALAGLGMLVAPTGVMRAWATEGRETFEVVKTDEEWKAILTPEQYRILRREGTEPSFSNAFHQSKDPGRYHCAGCDLAVFSSESKYDSQTGWPSFRSRSRPKR